MHETRKSDAVGQLFLLAERHQDPHWCFFEEHPKPPSSVMRLYIIQKFSDIVKTGRYQH
jgi:hypothetical protein